MPKLLVLYIESKNNRLDLYRATPFFLHYIEEGLSLSTVTNAEKPRYNYAIEHFVRVYILASSKHKEGWENLRQLCKQETSSRKGFAYLSRILPAPRMLR